MTELMKERPILFSGPMTSAPEGETCGSCAHLTTQWGRYFKCSKGTMSRCASSDLRKKWRACWLWEPEAS